MRMPYPGFKRFKSSLSGWNAGMTSMKKIPSLSNSEIAEILSEMAAFYDMQRMDYKRRAYELAAADVKIFPENISELYHREGRKGLMSVSSVGASIATHIEELLKTGRFAKYEEFKRKIPVNLTELMAIDGVGPRTIRELWLRLKIKNIDELEQACKT